MEKISVVVFVFVVVIRSNLELIVCEAFWVMARVGVPHRAGRKSYRRGAKNAVVHCKMKPPIRHAGS